MIGLVRNQSGPIALQAFEIAKFGHRVATAKS